MPITIPILQKMQDKKRIKKDKERISKALGIPVALIEHAAFPTLPGEVFVAPGYSWTRKSAGTPPGSGQLLELITPMVEGVIILDTLPNNGDFGYRKARHLTGPYAEEYVQTIDLLMGTLRCGTYDKDVMNQNMVKGSVISSFYRLFEQFGLDLPNDPDGIIENITNANFFPDEPIKRVEYAISCYRHFCKELGVNFYC